MICQTYTVVHESGLCIPQGPAILLKSLLPPPKRIALFIFCVYLRKSEKNTKALRDLLPVENIPTVPRVETEIPEEKTSQIQKDGVGDGTDPG